jgi:hypothetical protein
VAEYIYSNEKENRFWLQIIGDNTIIISNKLPSNDPDAERAGQFANRLDALLARARQDLPAVELDKLNREASAEVMRIRGFILGMIREQLTKGKVTYIIPLYLNNIVSYIDKYLYLLSAFIQNKNPEYIPIEQDLYWLPILYTDAWFLHDNSGIFLKEIRQKAMALSGNLSELYEYATLQKGLNRIGTTEFPMREEYRKNVRDTVESFAVLAVDLIGLVRIYKLPGTLTLLDLDSLYRRLCYYMTQLNITANVPHPACEPDSPRLSTV